jgi:RNA polymerase sigma-70 factor (ECF subfamily)
MAETDPPSLQELLRGGDQAVAKELFDTYVDRLVSLARKRISQRLASRIDAEDIVQSVFRTFFVRARQGQFTINDADDVCKMLARITVHKTFRQIAHHLAGKRSAAREAAHSEEHHELIQTLRGKEPTPEEAASLLDQLEHFLQQLKPEDREILEMRMQGFSSLEIAEKLKVSDRKIRRLMERIRGLAAREEIGPTEEEK